MNKNRRKRLTKVVGSLEKLSDEQPRQKIETTLSDSQNEVEVIADEEQDALDALPENLAPSQRADDMGENVNDLYDASADLETALSEYKDEHKEYREVKGDVNSAVKSIQKAINR
jgi:chromosome segregation ATPase